VKENTHCKVRKFLLGFVCDWKGMEKNMTIAAPDISYIFVNTNK